MTTNACPEPNVLMRTLKNLHATTAPVLRKFAENILAMQTSDPARRTASRASQMMGTRDQMSRDMLNKLSTRRGMWDNVPAKETWTYLKAAEKHGTQDMIDRLIASGSTRSAAELAAKNGFAATMRRELQAMNPQADPAHIATKSDFMANEWMLHRGEMEHLFQWDAAHGSKAEYVKNYIAHIFKDVARAQDWLDEKVKVLGPKWYQKMRTYELMEQAVKDKLELKYTNPIDIIHHRWMASINANSAVDMLRKMQKDGDAIPVITKEEALNTNPNAIEGVDYPSQYQKNRWRNSDGEPTRFYASDRQEWLIRPEAQNVVRNAFDQDSLFTKGGAIGTAADAFRQVKNVVMPINLGLSGFHALHLVSLIAPAQALVRAIRLSAGKGAETWMHNLVDAGKFTMRESIFNWPLDKIGMGFGKALDDMSGGKFSGSLARRFQQWENMPPADRVNNPEADAWVKWKQEGGAKFTRPEMESSNYIGAFKKARKNKELSMIPKGALAALESIQKPLFNHFIPQLKIAHWMQEVAAFQKLHPDVFADDAGRRFALQQITRNLDDRFGEMHYNTLFMNKLVKDVAVMSTVSFSWNYGFARQMAGGAANIGREGIGRGTELQKRMMKTDDKAKFIMAYAGLTGALAGVTTYLLTGKMPEGTDYIYPRTGLTNADGTPGRLNVPTNFRDIPMAIGHAQQHNSIIAGAGQLLWSKTILQPYLDAVTGKDWKGGDLYDTSRPWVIRNMQLADSVLGEMVQPMGVEGAMRAGEVPGAGFREKALAVAGFPPAPKYVGYDAFENRIMQMGYDRRGPTAYQYGEKTGLGRGLVQGAIRAVAGDQLKGEVRHEANVELERAKAASDQAGVYKAHQKQADQGQMTKGAIKYQNPRQQVERTFATLPIEDQKALVRDMTANQFTRFVRTNQAFGDRRLKHNQQELLKLRPS